MQLPKRKSEQLAQSKKGPQDNYLTEEKIEQLKRTLERLEKIEQPKAREELTRTREMGDLSENAAYQEAKYQLRRLNGRILNLKERIKHAIPIKPDDSGRIQIGSKVTVLAGDRQRELTILGAQESNPFKGTISYLSPLGQALMGNKATDEIPFKHNGTTTIYKILQVK